MTRSGKQWKTGSSFIHLPVESRAWLNAGSISCAAETEALVAHLWNGGSGGSHLWGWLWGLLPKHSQNYPIFLVSPISEPFLIPCFFAFLQMTQSHSPKLPKDWALASNLVYVWTPPSLRRSEKEVYTSPTRPRRKVPKSDLGFNACSAPCLLAVWPQASHLASLSFSFLFHK